MNWFWIIVIIVFGCAIINPVLYFIYWELYNRSEWIRIQTFCKDDPRFWSGEYDSFYRKQIAPIRPQIKDVWESTDNYWTWWFPICSSISTAFYICAIITKPLEKSWKWVVNKIANLKV